LVLFAFYNRESFSFPAKTAHCYWSAI